MKKRRRVVKDTMRQFSSLSKVSWIATDWSIATRLSLSLSPARQTTPRESRSNFDFFLPRTSAAETREQRHYSVFWSRCFPPPTSPSFLPWPRPTHSACLCHALTQNPQWRHSRGVSLARFGVDRFGLTGLGSRATEPKRIRSHNRPGSLLLLSCIEEFWWSTRSMDLLGCLVRGGTNQLTVP